MQGNISHRRERKVITNMRDQDGMKLKWGSDKPMRTKTVSSMINSVNRQNLKMNNAKSNIQSTQDSTWKK
jgi:hypothetical protein